ncbi:hypothetical protein FRC04_008479 [Tulasnella sp. 424]|nr:hypothetical protein FRC04_008479 [Tulasnella sp. 424]KAG8973960.1 hypothetical protein FRC05_008017 [Tulasnella sp. 425]
MADASTNGSSPSSPSTPPSSSSRLTKSALTAHDKAFAVASASAASSKTRPYTPAAGLTSRRYSTPGAQRMTMTIPISPPPSVSGKSPYPSNASPQSPAGPGYSLPMTPSASTVSGQSRRASLTSSQSVAHAFGYTTSTASTPARYFPLPSPVDPNVRAPPVSSPVTKVPTPNLETIQEVSSSGSGSHSRSGSTVAKGGGPPTPNGSTKSSLSRSGSLSNRSPTRRPSTSKSPYFHWEPGACPTPIYDPEYPNGSPECLSPRRLSSATPSSAEEGQARDYFSQPIRRHYHEGRPSPRPHREERSVSTTAKTVVSSTPPLKGKDGLPPTPGDGISITPSPPISTKCGTPYSENLETPLSLSEFTLSNNHMGTLDSIFGRVVAADEKDLRPLRAIPWNEMPQFIRRQSRELERREKERAKIVAKDQVVRDVKRREKMTVTEARLVAGEWKLMEDIPPTLELVQRAGRDEEKRMRVRIDGSVELTGIGFLRDLPADEQRRLLQERTELDKWLRGDVKEKPKFLLDEMAAYEKRLEDGVAGLQVEGRKVEFIEAPPPTVVVTAAQAEGVKLASVAEVDESEDTSTTNDPDNGRCASPFGT